MVYGYGLYCTSFPFPSLCFKYLAGLLLLLLLPSLFVYARWEYLLSCPRQGNGHGAKRVSVWE